MSILDSILEHKVSVEIPARKKRLSNADVRRQAEAVPRVESRNFISAVRRTDGYPALIAEVKRASPSKGDLWKGPFHPAEIAGVYAANGAAAISVLTDEQFFKGSLDHLRQVRAAVDLPLLRKDFIVDEYQIHEARVAGADAVLLIAAALNDEMLGEFMDIVEHHGMAALVEVHDVQELERALHLEALLIGVNNRDLRTFEVNMDVTARCAQRVRQNGAAAHVTLVSESGIANVADAKRAGLMGAHAVLVGEALIVSADIAAQVAALAKP